MDKLKLKLDRKEFADLDKLLDAAVRASGKQAAILAVPIWRCMDKAAAVTKSTQQDKKVPELFQ